MEKSNFEFSGFDLKGESEDESEYEFIKTLVKNMDYKDTDK